MNSMISNSNISKKSFTSTGPKNMFTIANKVSKNKITSNFNNNSKSLSPDNRKNGKKSKQVSILKPATH